MGVEVLEAVKGEAADRGRARSWLARHPFDPALAEAVARHAGRFDAAVLTGPRMLQYSPEAAGAGCVLADYVDDPVLEYARRGGGGGGPLARLTGLKSRWARARYEGRFLRPVAVTTFVSEADCESFRRRHPRARIECVPNGVDVDYFDAERATSQAPPACGGDSSPRIVFTGHMSNPNNQRAAAYLVRQVMPRLWRRRPDAAVQIVGADPDAATRALAGERVEVTGEVADMRPYLWGASAVVLPMQSGTGIKNKLLEAWAAGAAVVATPLACQGVPARDGENLLVADSADGLAEAAGRVLADRALAGSLGRAGRRTVEEGMSWDAAARRLAGLAEGLVAGGSEAGAAGAEVSVGGSAADRRGGR